jgi:small redox-active disulfide protein 2
MDIAVLGPGCAKCKSTVSLIEAVAADPGKTVHVEKIEDMRRIIGFGVMTTPAVVIAGAVVHKGSIPSREQILGWLG